MASQNFVIRDSVEYIYRNEHYRSGSFVRSIKRKLYAVKGYLLLVIFCGAVGAAATFLFDVEPQPLQQTSNPLKNLEQLKSLSGGDKEKLMEQIKNNPGMIEQYKDFAK